MKLLSREDALNLKVKRYFTGVPCRAGHVAERHVASRECMVCARINSAKYRIDNREKVLAALKRDRTINSAKRKAYRRTHWKRDQAYRWKYSGLPEPTRPQGTECELCGGPPNGVGSLNLDHCHETGRFRGWLCWSCNTALGKLGDNITGILLALDYLQRAES